MGLALSYLGHMTTFVGLRKRWATGIHGRSAGEPEFVSSKSPSTPIPLIVIVDDDEDVRTALDDLLSSLGYTARLFETADAFLASGFEDPIDCVISDVQMPGTSGLQLARHLQTRSIPTILITAFPTPEVESQAGSAGVRRVLVKPFDSGELITELEALLS